MIKAYFVSSNPSIVDATMRYQGAKQLLNFKLGLKKKSAQERTKEYVRSYGVRLGAGASYKVSKDARFFARLILSYIYSPQSSIQQILTPSRTSSSNPAILGDVRADVFYPSNNTLGINLKIGFGF